MILKYFSTVLLIATSVGAWAQDSTNAKHYLTVDLGGGLHNVAFSTDGYGSKDMGMGFGGAIGYRCYFNPNWGAGIGFAFNTFSAKATLNYNQDEQEGIDHSILGEHKERNYHTAFTNVGEKVKISAIDIPVGVFYQHPLNQKWTIGAGLNLIVSSIASSKYENNSGDVRVVSVLPYYEAELYELPEHGLSTYSGFSGTPDLKKISIGFGAECRAYYAINKRLELSMGISVAYRFSDLKNQNFEKLYDEDNRKYVGVTQTSYCGAVKLVNISASVGIRYRLKHKVRPVPSPELVYTDISSLYFDDPLEIIEPPVEEKKLERHADDYGINLMPENYAFANNALDMSAQLRRKQVGDPIGAPILFATNSDRLKSSENSIMDTVVVFMKENPDVTKLEVSAHTDNVGSDTYNLNLSKRRANTVVNYLVNHGVERKRLSPVGYGESKPLNKNADKEQREINRRVEFMILELEE